MNRRAFVGAVGVGAVGTLAGCLGSLVDELTTFTATPAEVSEETLEATGYELHDSEEQLEEETIAGETVEIRSYLNEYARTIDLSALGLGTVEAGAFGTIASPQVEVAGNSYNPIGEMDQSELVEYVQDRYDELEIDTDEERDERELEALSGTVTVTTFEGIAAFEDEDVAVYADLADPDHGGDHLVLAAIYPQALPNEDERVDELIEGIIHE